nr:MULTISPECIES: hypothetical protein [Halorubrum]
MNGREYVPLDDVKAVVADAFVNRLALTSKATVQDTSPTTVVNDIVERIEVPAAPRGAPRPAADRQRRRPQRADLRRRSPTSGTPRRS